MKNKIKKIRLIGIIIAAMFIFNMIQAQGSMGIRAGVNISKQDFENNNQNQDIKSKLGADIALVWDFPVSSPITLSPELHWIQKGAKIENLDGPFTESIRTFDYLEIPVLLRIHFGEGSGIFLLGGPSVGYLLNGTDKDGDGNRNDIDLDFYKRAEFGAHVGGGIALGAFLLDVRYIVGLTNIFDDNTDLQITNRGYSAGATIMF